MKLTEHVHALRIPFKVRPNPTVVLDRFVYCFLIVEKEIALIDAGVAGTETLISAYLKDIGRDINEVTRLVQTHAHPDHIGSSKAIKGITGCKVMIHEAERGWLEDVGRQVAERPVPGFNELVGGSVQVDTGLADGNMVRLGEGSSLKVVHTPGHSPGSICLNYDRDSVLFTGDVVPLPGDMPIYDDAAMTLASVVKVRGMKFNLMLSAWDEPRAGKEAERTIGSGIEFLKGIQEAVDGVLREQPQADDVILTKMALERAGLGHIPPMPLVVRSIRSNRAVSGQGK